MPAWEKRSGQITAEQTCAEHNPGEAHSVSEYTKRLWDILIPLPSAHSRTTNNDKCYPTVVSAANT